MYHYSFHLREPKISAVPERVLFAEYCLGDKTKRKCGRGRSSVNWEFPLPLPLGGGLRAAISRHPPAVSSNGEGQALFRRGLLTNQTLACLVVRNILAWSLLRIHCNPAPEYII